MPVTRERWRHRLPHWEVADVFHFVTIRCANSLPAAARVKVAEIHHSLQETTPATPQFAQLQRQYFRTCEKYLDGDGGFRPFLQKEICQIILAEWKELAVGGWQVTHYVIMPNHVHFLMKSAGSEVQSMRAVMREFKGRTSRLANKVLGRRGAFWQVDWFDRWMRDAGEVERVVEYLRQNPVKAGLVRKWQNYPWVN